MFPRSGSPMEKDAQFRALLKSKEPSFIHLSKSPVYEPPPPQTPGSPRYYRGPCGERSPYPETTWTYLPGFSVKELPPSPKAPSMQSHQREKLHPVRLCLGSFVDLCNAYGKNRWKHMWSQCEANVIAKKFKWHFYYLILSICSICRVTACFEILGVWSWLKVLYVPCMQKTRTKIQIM